LAGAVGDKYEGPRPRVSFLGVDAPHIERWPLPIGLALLIAVFVVASGWSGEGVDHMAGEAMWVLATSLPNALLWLAAAAGFGLPLRVWLAPHAQERMAVQAGLGVAALLTIDAALGRLGVLQFAGGAVAWVILILGVAIIACQLWRAAGTQPLRASALIWPAAPAIAVLLLAATAAPGWLWATEFGGYDVLSYHLQLPREWLALGAIAPLEHNVYSFLPNYVEGAYYHLAALRGDGHVAAYSCQILHAFFALLTAIITSRLALRLAGPPAAMIAGVLVIGTPWVIVTGSMAYNEMAAALMLATGLLVVFEAGMDQHKGVGSTCEGPPHRFLTGPALKGTGAALNDAWRTGAAIGILAAAACGAKLTAFGFVALPLGALMLWSVPPRRWTGAIAAGALAGSIVLAPYLLSNAAAAGNPVFPFATGVFGTGHWTSEQVERWNAAHIAGMNISERLIEGWNQLGRYGIGPSPYEASEPWRPQWLILPWLALVGLAIAHPWRWRLGAVMLIQIVFWLALTHVKSRFMLPLVVPAALITSLAAARLIPERREVHIPIGLLLLAWASMPLVLFATERSGAPAARTGAVDLLTGDRLTAEELHIAAMHNPAIHFNHFMAPGSRTLFVGEAAPFYFRGEFTYATVWDAHPLARAVDEQRPAEGGYTHLLVHPLMLYVWDQAGWKETEMAADHVLDWAERFGTLEHAWPPDSRNQTGHRLYRLPDDFGDH
jgi:hypothetical protein